MPFWGGPSGNSGAEGPQGTGPGGALTKEDISRTLEEEMNRRKLQEMVSIMQEKCYKRCVPQPASSLSGTEKTCMSQCVNKYLGTLDIVSAEWNRAVNQGRAVMPS